MKRLIVLMAFVSAAWAAETSPACDAAAMWEKMVEAKGGRERLYQVTTFLVQSRDLRDVGFFRLPDFIWSWRDQRPTVFGVDVGWNNSSLGIRKFQAGPCDNWDCRVRTVKDVNNVPFFQAQMLYFLETRFLKPEITGCGEERIKGKRRRYVEVTKGPVPVEYYLKDGKIVPGSRMEIGKLRVRYYVKKGEELPSLVVIHQGSYDETHFFKGYQAFGGIQLPTEERIRSRITNMHSHLRWEINPEYDATVLTRDPSLADGPDGWRPKAQRGRRKPEGPGTEAEYQVWRKKLQ